METVLAIVTILVALIAAFMGGMFNQDNEEGIATAFIVAAVGFAALAVIAMAT